MRLRFNVGDRVAPPAPQKPRRVRVGDVLRFADGSVCTIAQLGVFGPSSVLAGVVRVVSTNGRVYDLNTVALYCTVDGTPVDPSGVDDAAAETRHCEPESTGEPPTDPHRGYPPKCRLCDKPRGDSIYVTSELCTACANTGVMIWRDPEPEPKPDTAPSYPSLSPGCLRGPMGRAR